MPGTRLGIAQTFLDYVFAGSPAKDWVALANGVFAQAYKEMMKPSGAYATRPAAPPLPNAAYAGDYRNDYVGDARVEGSGGGGGLFLVLGPSGNRRFPLTQFNRDLFVYSPAAEAPDRRMGVAFLIGVDGKAVALGRVAQRDRFRLAERLMYHVGEGFQPAVDHDIELRLEPQQEDD